jgi:hypothetical protein
MVRFQYSLARELKMTRAMLIRTMSVTEFIDWIAFYRLEQDDQRRERERVEDEATARRTVQSMGGSFR